MDTPKTQVKIIQHGDVLLTRQAEPVAIPIQKQTHGLIQQLMAVMLEENGVGIAAPQIGESQQIIIIASRPNLRYPSAPSMEPLVMINPTIMKTSLQKTLGWEGCLSVPGVRGQVERFDDITVNFYSSQGELTQGSYSGFVARIIQHEIDHLEGKVFLDRVNNPEDVIPEEEYFQQAV